MRKTLAAAALVGTLAAGGATAAITTADSGPIASASARVAVPKLKCRRLDIAEDIVRGKGLKPVERGGGLFGIVVKSNWVVARTRPAAGTMVSRGSRVYLYAARSC